MRRFRLTIAALLLGCQCLLIATLATAADKGTVFFVTHGENRAGAAFFEQLKNAFPGTDNRFRFIDVKHQEPEQADVLYIAAGNRALEHLLEKSVGAPVLAIFISRLSFQQITHSTRHRRPGSGLSAIYADPSPLQQFFLTKHLFAGAPRTTAILSEKTTFLKAELEHAAGQAGIPFHATIHTEQGDISNTLNAIKKNEVVLALPDSSVYNDESVARIILFAYRHDQSIIGFSRQMVDAGGLATIYSDADHIQIQVIEALRRYFAEGTLPSPRHPKQFGIHINERVAESYNLVLPDRTALKTRIERSLEACCEQ